MGTWNYILTMSLTYTCALAGPFFSLMVIPEVAPAQVMLNGVPTLMPPKLLLVNITVWALATARAEAARRNLVNCILIDDVEGLSFC